MRLKRRTLMVDGKWLLLPGEPLPDIAQPELEAIAAGRSGSSQGKLRQRKASRTPMGLDMPHGSNSRYTNCGCRCTECRAAHAKARSPR
jgi:hypothetical protein